jgi:acylphosphatase
MSEAVHLQIEGRVQAVGFRAFVVREARKRGLRGWVRNLKDGRVEVLLIGFRADIDRVVEACRRGPAGAYVTGFVRGPAPDDGSTAFVELPTV